MIDRDDLKAAVAAGILNEAQASNLASLADARRGARENLAPGDEPFELFKGFNEIFIVVGLSILAFGWISFVTLWLVEDPLHVKNTLAISGVIAAAMLWFLSEYFIRRRRMVAPSIALSVLFAANAVYGFAGAYAQVFMIAQGDTSSLPLPLALATVALTFYWLRFKVPFALAVIALGCFGLAILLAGLTSGTPDSFSELFLLSAGGPFAWITLVLGLVFFAGAMSFDMSDPHRVTRRAANGFWLHIVAAPALVNTIALSLLEVDALWAHTVLSAILALFALVAIIIDRRSFLIAAIGYTVILSGTLFEAEAAVVTTLGLGVLLLILGAKWDAIRARLMVVLPPFIPKHRLPPTT